MAERPDGTRTPFLPYPVPLRDESGELIGALEHGAETRALDDRLSRTLIPLAKLTTAKQAVALASEAIESCGGAGYVEDTGLPRLLADAHGNTRRCLTRQLNVVAGRST